MINKNHQEISGSLGSVKYDIKAPLEEPIDHRIKQVFYMIPTLPKSENKFHFTAKNVSYDETKEVGQNLKNQSVLATHANQQGLIKNEKVQKRLDRLMKTKIFKYTYNPRIAEERFLLQQHVSLIIDYCNQQSELLHSIPFHKGLFYVAKIAEHKIYEYNKDGQRKLAKDNKISGYSVVAELHVTYQYKDCEDRYTLNSLNICDFPAMLHVIVEAIMKSHNTMQQEDKEKEIRAKEAQNKAKYKKGGAADQLIMAAMGQAGLDDQKKPAGGNQQLVVSFVDGKQITLVKQQQVSPYSVAQAGAAPQQEGDNVAAQKQNEIIAEPQQDKKPDKSEIPAEEEQTNSFLKALNNELQLPDGLHCLYQMCSVKSDILLYKSLGIPQVKKQNQQQSSSNQEGAAAEDDTLESAVVENELFRERTQHCREQFIIYAKKNNLLSGELSDRGQGAMEVEGEQPRAAQSSVLRFQQNLLKDKLMEQLHTNITFVYICFYLISLIDECEQRLLLIDLDPNNLFLHKDNNNVKFIYVPTFQKCAQFFINQKTSDFDQNAKAYSKDQWHTQAIELIQKLASSLLNTNTLEKLEDDDGQFAKSCLNLDIKKRYDFAKSRRLPQFVRRDLRQTVMKTTLHPLLEKYPALRFYYAKQLAKESFTNKIERYQQQFKQAIQNNQNPIQNQIARQSSQQIMNQKPEPRTQIVKNFLDMLNQWFVGEGSSERYIFNFIMERPISEQELIYKGQVTERIDTEALKGSAAIIEQNQQPAQQANRQQQPGIESTHPNDSQRSFTHHVVNPLNHNVTNSTSYVPLSQATNPLSAQPPQGNFQSVVPSANASTLSSSSQKGTNKHIHIEYLDKKNCLSVKIAFQDLALSIENSDEIIFSSQLVSFMNPNILIDFDETRRINFRSTLCVGFSTQAMRELIDMLDGCLIFGHVYYDYYTNNLLANKATRDLNKFKLLSSELAFYFKSCKKKFAKFDREALKVAFNERETMMKQFGFDQIFKTRNKTDHTFSQELESAGNGFEFHDEEDLEDISDDDIPRTYSNQNTSQNDSCELDEMSSD